jgi:hypothetical protein
LSMFVLVIVGLESGPRQGRRRRPQRSVSAAERVLQTV